MDRVEALEHIKNLWNNEALSLGEKIINISNDYYSVGLDLSTTAAYIRATPAELDALLALSALEEDLIERISRVSPPKTTWSLLSNASEDEIRQALSALEEDKKTNRTKTKEPVSEYIYQQMLEVAGPTSEQLVGMLSGGDLAHALKKGQDFSAFSDWELKFFKSIVAQKKRGKALSGKQITIVVRILNTLADKKAIVRESIDGDREICDRILDAIER